MRIEYTGRHAAVPDEVRGLAERKLGKVARLLPGITDVHVVVASDKRRQIAEVSLHSPHLTLTAARESGDIATALGAAIETLARQAQRHVGKLRARKRTGGDRGAHLAAPAVGQERVPRVIRSRRFVAKPMTIEEAALELAASDVEFLVYRDTATERFSVLYKRKDGNLGLIEPGA
jgi:putative sigma-54 modulation protein